MLLQPLVLITKAHFIKSYTIPRRLRPRPRGLWSRRWQRRYRLSHHPHLDVAVLEIGTIGTLAMLTALATAMGSLVRQVGRVGRAAAFITAALSASQRLGGDAGRNGGTVYT